MAEETEKNTESNEDKLEKAIKKAVYHIAAGSIILVENDGNEDISKNIIRKIRGNWKVVIVGKKHKDKWDVEYLLLRSNGFFKGIMFGKMPRDRILIIENADAISERNLKMIRYFYDENNLKSVVMITQDASIINKLPDAMKNRIGNRIIKI